MAITFHAHRLDVSEEDWGVRILLSADDALDAERYLMTQRKHRRVQLDGEAARRMRDDGVIEVSCDLTNETRAALQAALRKTFDERAYYVDRIV